MFCVRAFARRSLQLSLQSPSAELHAELHAGSNQKVAGACFQPRLTRQPAKSYGSYGSYGHTVAVGHSGCATLPHHLPGIEASRPRHMPGIEASSLPSLRHTEVGIPTVDFGILPEKPITGPAPKVRQRVGPRSLAAGVFFPTIFTTRRPASRLQIWQVTQRNGEDQAVSYDRV